MDKVFEKANGIRDEIVEIRRDIHMHPERGHQEFRTAGIIREKMKEFGVDEILTPTETSTIAVIKGRKGPGKTVGIRADIDALPVTEDTGLEFASVNEGVMHACGHDLHASMMIGNAKILCDLRDEFAGTVKVIFQHSEEIQPGGSREILATGMLDDCDAFFGMHVQPTEGDVGKIMIKSGPVCTSGDMVHIDVHGKGGHGSQPHKANDAILAACQLNVLFNQIQARNIDPMECAVLSVNTIQGGLAENIMAGECHMSGSPRAYNPEVRQIIHDKMEEICKGVEIFSGCKIDFDYTFGYDAVINDADLFQTVIDDWTATLGEDFFAIMEKPQTFSEDYSFYSTKTGKPSVMFFLNGGHMRDLATLHNAKCSFNEDCIPYGMTAMCHAALAFLAK